MGGLSSLVFGNAVSKVLAFLREVAFAAWFGTSSTATAYRVALSGFNIPTQALLGESLSAGLLPLYNKLRNEDPVAGKALILVASAVGCAISLLIMFLLYFGSDQIVRLLAPGVSSDIARQATSMLKILALATPFFVLGGTLSHIEAAHGNFAAIAMRPVVINVMSIAGAALAYYLKADFWLVVTFLVGHIIFLTRSIVGVLSVGLSGAPAVRGYFGKALRLTLSTALPLVAIPFFAQMNLVVERAVSSHIGAPVIPAVDYARFIMDTWVNVLALPFSVFTLAKFGGIDGEKFAEHVDKMLAGLLVVSAPVGILTAMNAEALVAILYKRGSFNSESAHLTSSILVWLGVALTFVVCSYYLVRVLNAKLLPGRAVLITIIACACNSAFNILFWKKFGPATIGMGVAIYGAVLFVLGAIALKIHIRFMRVAPVFALGVALQVGVGLLINSLTTSGKVQLAISTAGAALIWGAIIYTNRQLKEAIEPVSLAAGRLIKRFAR